MTAIELQKPSSLGHVQASLVATLAQRVFKVEQDDVVGMSRAEITWNPKY
jgi:hypothetical protein